MPQTRRNDVNPIDLSDKYQMALQDSTGQWVGFGVDDFVTGVKGYPLNQSPAQQKLEQMSFHLGRGVERWLPGNFSYYDSKDGWRLTPGKYHASPLYHFARGMRDHNTNAPGSASFKPLVGGAPLAVSFVAAAEYTGGTTYVDAHNWILLRKRVLASETGSPGTLTHELRNSGGTVLSTETLVASSIADVTSQWYDFVPATPGTLTVGATYYHVLYGATGDASDRCWEIGCDNSTAGLTAAANNTAWASWTATTYSPFYRTTDADTARVIWPFPFDSGFYALTSNDAGGASKLFVNGVRGQATGTQTGTTLVDTTYGSNGTATAWATNRYAGAYVRLIRGTGAGQVRQIASNTGGTIALTSAWAVTPGTGTVSPSEYVVYGTDWFSEIASAFSAPVVSRPAYANGIMYFPMGDSTDIRRMHLNYGTAQVHEFANEGTKHNQASFLVSGYISVDGPVLWRGNNALTAAGTPVGSKVSVARANLAGLAWGTDLTFRTSILMGDNTQTINNLWVHTNKLFCFKEDQLFGVENDVPVQIKAGVSAYPSRRNGVGVATGTDSQLYAGLRHDIFIVSGSQILSTGLQRDAGITSSRSGYASDIESVNAWNFCAIDAGDTGTSSIMIHALDTQTYGENIRAFAVGRRIRSVRWQPCENTNPRLWFECGGELLYQAFPVWDVRPLNDASMQYMWETVLETSTIDLLSVDAKYFSTLSAVTKHLAELTDVVAGHEIFVEYQVDNDVGTSRWKSAGVFSHSPSQSLAIEEGSRRMIRLRYRLFTSEVLVPTILERFALTMVSRTPTYHGWDVLATIDTDDEEQSSLDTIKWLNKRAAEAEKLTLTSVNPLYHGKTVLLQNEPLATIEEYDVDAQDVSGRIWLKLAELA